jgi:hypothetical protein
VAPPIHFALASEASGLDYSRLVKIARAVERQIVEHVGPVWDVAGTVTAYHHLSEAPQNTSPVLVSDKFKFQSLGVHLHRAFDNRPFALVKAVKQPDVSVAISHEIIEILVDPTGDRMVSAPSVKSGQDAVEYLLEVCDPPEAYPYSIDGQRVSDFCTPAYYDIDPHPGVAYTHNRAVSRPREVLAKGYLSWLEPVSGAWWQLRRFDGGGTEYAPVSGIGALGVGTRARVDRVTPGLYEALTGPEAEPVSRRATAWQRRPVRRRLSRNRRERALREVINALQRGDEYPPDAASTS